MTTWKIETTLIVDCYFEITANNLEEANEKAERLLAKGEANIKMLQTAVPHRGLIITEV